MTGKPRKPEWVPENSGDEFTTRVVAGVGHHAKPHAHANEGIAKRSELSADDYVRGVLDGNLTHFARAITLVESNSPKHIEKAQSVLQALAPHRKPSIRVGITGMPGAGKSTLIETLGLRLISLGHKLAVLAIDPSSTLTRGSVLGDKTRMENLAREPRCFIRPSPSGGALGGVARKTRETVLVCEAAGFDVILIETVGVGQSEVTVRSMVDFFLLVQLAGAGDELQGIKKGVMELADAVLINKADGDNKQRAESSRGILEQALHYLSPATPGWTTPALTCSALENTGVDSLWNTILTFREHTTQSGVFDNRRREQNREWVHEMLKEYILGGFYRDPLVVANLPRFEQAVLKGDMTVTAAVTKMIDIYENRRTT